MDETIAPLGKSLVILDLQIDTSTPAGRMVLTKIADYLNAQSIPTKRGGTWHHSTVRKVLNR